MPQVDTPFPGDEITARCEAAAELILAETGVKQGWCLVLDCGEGRLACALARRGQLRVVGVDPDAEAVERGRRILQRAGLYGDRVTLHAGSAEKLRYPDYFANLVVSEETLRSGRLPDAPEEILRVLRPSGGTALIGALPTAEGSTPGNLSPARLERWAKRCISNASGNEARQDTRVLTEMGAWAMIRRAPLPGTGEWTHMYGDPANTACSEDRLARPPLRLQWFGRPGPRLMIDRHHRNVPPLYKAGRLFVPADDRIIALDAYNGTWLWDRAVPGSRRLGVFLDSSHIVVDDEHLYLAHHDRVSRFDPATGRDLGDLVLPQHEAGNACHWSYLARRGDLLLGSGRLPGASYTETSHAADMALWYDHMALVTSRYLFALDHESGAERWAYRGGVILNTTITVGGGRVYFLETLSPKAMENELGRMEGQVILEGDANFLVVLDEATGKPIYRQKMDLKDCRLIAYLNYKDEILLLSGGEYRENRLWYSFRALDAATGKERWRRSHDSGFAPGAVTASRTAIPPWWVT